MEIFQSNIIDNNEIELHEEEEHSKIIEETSNNDDEINSEDVNEDKE